MKLLRGKRFIANTIKGKKKVKKRRGPKLILKR